MMETIKNISNISQEKGEGVTLQVWLRFNSLVG